MKSDTLGSDLFYRFDTVGRYHAAQTPGASVAPELFVRWGALGKAILYAKPLVECLNGHGLPEALLKDHPEKLGEERRRAVVLIDEIDKAPRDVPNDILTEIERMGFGIPEVELDMSLSADEACYRPLVIITSNSEKSLPEAFLRRCVYFHLDLPPFARDCKNGANDVTVEDVVGARLGERYTDHGPLAAEIIGLFRHLRRDEVALQNPPSLAELINCLDLLLPPKGEARHALPKEPEPRLLVQLRTTLLKGPEEQARVLELYRAWRTDCDA